MGYYFYLVGQVVEDQQRIRQHQHRLRKTKRVVIRSGQCFKVSGHFVTEIADDSTMETGQAGYRHRLVMLELLFDKCQRVNGVFPAGFYNQRRFRADEAVAGEPFPALHALQKK